MCVNLTPKSTQVIEHEADISRHQPIAAAPSINIIRLEIWKYADFAVMCFVA